MLPGPRRSCRGRCRTARPWRDGPGGGPAARPGLMISGGGCQGKTETACEAMACYEGEWLALYQQNPSAAAGTLDLHVPAVYVRTPVKATPISACQRILDFYGEPHKGMRLEEDRKSTRLNSSHLGISY